MISIIIPIFNVEKYLLRCLESVLSQSFQEYEAVLIDDGSTDSSGEIADVFCKNHEKFKVFHKSNGGLSDARNFGIDNSTGEYIYFLDSDDFIEPNALELLFSQYKNTEADIVCASADYITEDGTHLRPLKGTPPGPIELDGMGAVRRFYDENYVYLVVAWNKLYKRALFLDVRYPKGLKNEDEATTPLLLYLSQKVVMLPNQTLHYTQRADSIMGLNKNSFHWDVFETEFIRAKFFLGKEEKEFFCNDYRRIVEQYLIFNVTFKRDELYKSKKNVILKQIKEWKKSFFHNEKRRKNRLFVRLALLCPCLLRTMLRMRNGSL